MAKDPNLPRNRLAPLPSRRGRGQFGLPVSLLLHAAIIGGALFTWQHHYEFPDVSPPVVPVELVTIADKTNIKQVAPEPALTPKPEQPIEPQQPVEAPPPLPQVTAPPPVPIEPAPQIAPPKPEAEAEAPKIVAKTPPPSPPKVVPQQRPEPPRDTAKPADKKKTDQFNINNVLALLNKNQPPANATAKGVTGAQPHRGFGAQNAMTMELADALRNAIAQCWSPPVGAPHPTDLIVGFELFLNPDGSVARPPQLTANFAAAVGANPFTRAAAEAARRAIYECAPYHLPADRYNDWRDISLTFDPRQMMGGQ